MKKIFAFAALCAAVLVSCTQKEIAVDTPVEEQSDVKLIPITITANFEGVKSDMVDAAWTWKSGDKLAVYDGTAKQEFTLDESSAGTSVAKFMGSVTKGFTSLQAVFPYDKAGDSFGTPLIPAEQSITDGTVDANAMIAVASEGEKVSDNEYNFYFTSGVSLLRFTPPSGATKVIFHAAAKGETLAGDSPSVTVDLSNAAADGTKRFWAAVNPAKLSGIHVFTLKNDGKYYRLGTEKEIDLSTPGKGKNLGSLAAGTEVAVIETGDQLATYLNSTPALDAYIVKDLDLTKQSITSCANFTKNFDGLWHSIGNWTSEGVALFTSTTSTATIQNLILDDSCLLNFPSTMVGSFGFVICSNNGKLINCVNEAKINCSVSGSTNAEAHDAAIVGITNKGGVISGCINKGDITIALTPSTKATTYFGGVSGKINNATIENSTNHGNITITCNNTSTKNYYIGGVTGSTNSSSQTNYCENYGHITFNTPDGAAAVTMAGVTSYTAGTISHCRNEGNVTYSSDNHIKGTLLGGIAGYCAEAINDCYNKGNISVDAIAFNGRNPIGNYVIEVKDSEGNVTTEAKAKSTVVALIGGVCGGGAPWNATSSRFSASSCQNDGNISISLSKIQQFTVNPAAAARYCIGGVIGDASGPLSLCSNTGEVSVSFSTGGEEFTSDNAGNTCYIGGVVGSNYYSLTQSELNMTACTNSGKVEFNTTDNYIGTNNCIGGVVGWPGLEDSSRVTKLTGCSNNGNININASVKYRSGGVAGGSGPLEQCINNGSITVNKAGAGSVVGGIIGFLTQKHSISGCYGYGSITSIVNLEGMGGLIGNIGNYSYSTGVGCKVNCTLSGGPIDKTGLMIGKFNGAKKITFGSEEDPVKIKGVIDGTSITSENYSTYLTGSSNAATHSIHAVFGE